PITLQKFIAWCHKGPKTARVDKVEMNELGVDVTLTDFVRN
ncbi:partial acylphosphatase, partial [Candidatus Brocadiaceae bacterium]